MTPALELALISTLAASALVAASATGAALVLGCRDRSQRSAEVAKLVEELAAQRQALEAVLTRLDLESSSVASKARRSSPIPLAKSQRSRPEVEPRPTLIAVPDLAAVAGSNPGEPAAASAELGRRFGAIWALAEAGSPAEVIARETRQPIGQVELILGLRRQLDAASAANGTGVGVGVGRP